MIGIAIALSVRIGGLLLVCYVGLFALLASFMLPKVRSLFVKKNFKQVFKMGGLLLGAVVLGVLIGLLFYPNFFEEGIKHLQSSFSRATNNSFRVPIIFEGENTDSLKIPWHYLMKMFYITTPVFILVLLHWAILILLLKWKKIGALNVFILLFTFVFPFAYMMYTKAPVYNGWRHVLFAYVTIPAITAIGLKETLCFFKKSIPKFVIIACIITASIYLLAWNVRNAPYQIGYFNSSVGGTKGALKNYDLNSLQLFANEGTYWILNSLNPDDYSEDKRLVIAMNNDPIRREFYIPPEWRGKVELKTISFRNYSSLECDYTVLTTAFASQKILSFFWPPKGTVFDRVVDGAVLGCVVDRRDHTDWKGIKLVQGNQFEEGMKLLEQAYEYNPKNYTLFFWLGYGYYRTGNLEKAIEFLNKYEKFYPNDDQAHRMLGYVYYAQKEYDKALKSFNIAFAQKRSDLEVANMLALCLYEKKDYKAAIKFLEPLVNENPSFTQGKNLLEYILRLTQN
jgi:tetratricopeptide (TPR) repeat protein